LDTTDHVWRKVYFDQTLVDPFCCILLAAMVIMILFAPRRYAVWPLIVVACFITQAQRLSVASLDFTFLRILTIIGCFRVFIHGEYRGFKWNGCDTAMIVFMGIRTAYAFLHITKNVAITPVSMCGDTLDAWGQYFFFRCVVRDLEDLRWATYGFMIASIPNAITMIIEWTTEVNPYYFMGGVQQSFHRGDDNALRCMNAYSHPILAGAFWAPLLPLMGAMIKQKGRIKILPLIAIGCAAVIIVACHSSSPVAGAGLAFMGGVAFLFRKRIRLIRWSFFFIVLAAQLLANSPVWKIFARLHIVGGSTGYYRFKLIDQFVHHWQEWLFVGSAKGTSTWDMPMFDIVNYYVVLGLGGGLLFIILIVWLMAAAYKNCGKALESAAGNKEDELLAWATGVSVFVHMMTFLAVTYFGQIMMIWYFSLAITGVVSRNPMRRGFSVLTGWAKDPLSRMASRRVLPYGQPARVGHSY